MGSFAFGAGYFGFYAQTLGGAIEGDLVTTANAYFRRSVTSVDVAFARAVTGEDATFRRTVTTADAER
jgi:hypothetical protein